MQIQTSLATLKLHNERLVKFTDELEENFGDLTIHPKMSSEEIMYKAGQKSVVDYIKTKMEEE